MFAGPSLPPALPVVPAVVRPAAAPVVSDQRFSAQAIVAPTPTSPPGAPADAYEVRSVRGLFAPRPVPSLDAVRGGPLSADGSVGVVGGVSSATGPSYIVFSQRSEGVTEVKRMLSELGYSVTTNDQLDNSTRMALFAVQRRAGVPPTGIIDRATLHVLERPDAPPAASAAAPVTATNDDTRTMTAQQAAQYLLDSPNVAFWSGLSTGSERRNVQRIADGLNPIAPRGGGETTINVNMLRALVAMAKEGRIHINALTGGGHSSGSRHYSGEAVDLERDWGLSTQRIVEIAAQYGGDVFHEGHVHLTFRR